MQSLAQFTPQAIIFTLVLARVGGMAVTAPLYSATAVPAHLRALLALGLALLVTPAQLGATMPTPLAPAEYLLAAGVEVLVGMALGLGAAVLLSAAQLGGQLMSQASGLSLSELFDPAAGAEVPVLSQLLGVFTTAIYLVVGGHRLLIGGLLDTFSRLPLASNHLPDSLAATLVTLVTESCSLAVRAAAPLIIALLMASIILGMIGRTLPQLNILTLGFGLNTLVAFVTLALALGGVAWLFEEQVQPTISLMLRAIAAAPKAAAGAL